MATRSDNAPSYKRTSASSASISRRWVMLIFGFRRCCVDSIASNPTATESPGSPVFLSGLEHRSIQIFLNDFSALRDFALTEEARLRSGLNANDCYLHKSEISFPP
jgi:hypothetical protein